MNLEYAYKGEAKKKLPYYPSVTTPTKNYLRRDATKHLLLLML